LAMLGRLVRMGGTAYGLNRGSLGLRDRDWESAEDSSDPRFSLSGGFGHL